MDGTVINNTNSHTIQVHMTYTDKTGDLAPDIKTLQGNQVSVAGQMSPADVLVSGAGKNMYVGVWGDDVRKGSPNSWVVFSTTNGQMLGHQFNDYALQISGEKSSGWVLTVDSAVGMSPAPGGGSSWLVILVVALLILIMIGIGVGVYFTLV